MLINGSIGYGHGNRKSNTDNAMRSMQIVKSVQGKRNKFFGTMKHRYAFFLCLAAVLCFSHVQAQKVTVDKVNASLQDVVKDLTKQTGYDFFFQKELLQKSRPVTIHETNKELREVLEKIFSNQPIEFSITNKTIVLREKSGNKSGGSKSLGLVVGHVTDVAGLPLSGVGVRYKNTQGEEIALYSDANGTFQVPVELGNKLVFSAVGYIPKEIIYNGENDFDVSLVENRVSLPDVQVSMSPLFKKKDPTMSVDLTTRSYMNLAQVLQGTIPGLSLQFVNSSKKIVTDVYEYHGTTFRHFSVEEYLAYRPTDGQKIIDALLNNQTSLPGYNLQLIHIVTQTSVSSALVPQLRGANNFSSNITGMLVVIDGFPKDEFPADYPMANVESVEVIKDPKELIKWGPKASGGIIMVKTKSPKRGSLTMNYNSNFYYSPAPKYSRDNMQLANSADVLDYMRDLVDSGMIS